MAIQRIQSISVVRAIEGLHSAARFLQNVPAWLMPVAGNSTLSRGIKDDLSFAVSSASIRCTSAAASANRPRWISQRGDSGSERRHHRSIKMGKAVTTWTIRQPIGELGTTE